MTSLKTIKVLNDNNGSLLINPINSDSNQTTSNLNDFGQYKGKVITISPITTNVGLGETNVLLLKSLAKSTQQNLLSASDFNSESDLFQQSIIKGLSKSKGNRYKNTFLVL
jgi:hypothetical protein